jgi:(2Fe-2S) ferredoxin
MHNNTLDIGALAADLKAEKQIMAKNTILVSMGTCGLAAGAATVYEALRVEVKAQGLEDRIEIVETGCMGLCYSEPCVELIEHATGKQFIYGNLTAGQAEVIVESGFSSTSPLPEIVRSWYFPEDEEATDKSTQAKIVLRNSGLINPEKIDDYIARDGYAALSKALTSMAPEDVIEVVDMSGLRGRGGGGFPAGRKWKIAAAQKSAEKYVICNADEGDPGAFMDRAILEGDPHAVLEAMVITGYAIGAQSGVIYIRAEYPLAIKRLEIAIAQAREKGLLGKNILGLGFDFDLKLKYGAGAFVCGEETALIRSVEGQRGMPTFKPPFPAIEGLWGKPTIVNNVETLANVCAIVRNGADWFRKIGTESSPGTKVFALAGKISKVGLV